MNKILLSLICLLLLPLISNAQFEKIEEKAPELLKQKAVVLFINSGECSNCYIFLNDAIRRAKESPYKDNLIFVTNNSVFTKNLLKEMDYDDVSKVFFDKNVFQNEQIKGYNTIVIVNGSQRQFLNKSTYESKTFSQLLNASEAEFLLLITQSKSSKSSNPFTKNHLFSDSLIANDIFSFGVCDYGALLYDQTMQNLYFLQEQDGKLNVRIDKLSFDDAVLYQSLPQRIDTSAFRLMPYEETQGIFKREKIPVLKVSVIRVFNNVLYCFYSVNKMYNQIGTEDMGVFSSNYISTFKITSKDAFEGISDISKFEQLYYADAIAQAGKRYPIGVWISDHAIIEEDNEMHINLDVLSDDEKDIQFAGKAKIKLIPDTHSIQILSVDAKAPKLIKVINEVSHNNQKYKLKKTIIDEENNIGNVELLMID